MFIKSALWFHKVNDTGWGINSYRKIVDFNDLDDFLYAYKMIESFSSGMFFLMKKDVKPVYEDKENKMGVYLVLNYQRRYVRHFGMSCRIYF